MVDRKDILLNDDNVPVVINGDLVVGPSDSQHVKHILEAAPGHFRFAPAIGADVPSSLNGLLDGSMRQSIQLHLSIDGYKVKSIEGDINNMTLHYER